MVQEWILGQPVETRTVQEWAGGQPHVVVKVLETLEFTGDLYPDSTGDFVEAGTHDYQPYYYNAVNDFYLWYGSSDSYWMVTKVVGEYGDARWYVDGIDNKISPAYLPHPGSEATGIGDMHVKVTQTILDYERSARGINRGVMVGMA